MVLCRRELLANPCRTRLERLATGRGELARLRNLGAGALAADYQQQPSQHKRNCGNGKPQNQQITANGGLQ
ncbi:hypothetical protein PPS_0654 [Pseudomonas putida S16]|nr:hypothetical protein PPS_0654 [Pseudomonas putida S16]